MLQGNDLERDTSVAQVTPMCSNNLPSLSYFISVSFLHGKLQSKSFISASQNRWNYAESAFKLENMKSRFCIRKICYNYHQSSA